MQAQPHLLFRHFNIFAELLKYKQKCCALRRENMVVLLEYTDHVSTARKTWKRNKYVIGKRCQPLHPEEPRQKGVLYITPE